MAKDTFGNVPNSTGGIRGISRQIAAVLAFNRKDGTKNGLTYGQHSALENQKHVQGVQRDVVNHVLGQTTAEQANEHKNQQIVAQGNQNRQTITHNFDTLTNAATNPSFKSINLTNGSAILRSNKKNTSNGMDSGQQWNNGVGGDTSSQAATNLDS